MASTRSYCTHNGKKLELKCASRYVYLHRDSDGGSSWDFWRRRRCEPRLGAWTISSASDSCGIEVEDFSSELNYCDLSDSERVLQD